MKYRSLGKTGLQVSEISLGCEGFVDHDGTFTPLLMDKAEELGINYLDFYTPNPDLRDRLGKAQGTLPETVREHYGVLEHGASECIACGACEKRCPFGVKIIDNMKEAVTVFGK